VSHHLVDHLSRQLEHRVHASEVVAKGEK
jgi:hypothetical protein